MWPCERERIGECFRRQLRAQIVDHKISLFDLPSLPFSWWPGMTTTPFLEESEIPQKGLNGSFRDTVKKEELIGERKNINHM